MLVRWSASVGFSEDRDEKLKARLRKMSDADLLRFGKAARYMCSAKANVGKPARSEFVVQLKAAREEWRRRHPRQCEALY